MKKKLALILSTVLAASFALAGCGGGEEPVVDENVEVAAGDLKTGIAIGATVAKSTDAAADAPVECRDTSHCRPPTEPTGSR